MRAKPVTEFKRRKRRPKVKFKVEDINYKNVELLKNFMNDKGKISPARVTGLEAKVQRKIAKAIKVPIITVLPMALYSFMFSLKSYLSL